MRQIKTIVVLVCFLFLQKFSYSQSNAYLDSLFSELRTVYRSGEIENTLEMSLWLLDLSESAKYQRGEVWAILYISDCLSLIGAYEKSLNYLKKLDNLQEYLEAHPYERWLLQKNKLENYRALGLTTLMKEQFNVSIKTIDSETDSLKQSIVFHSLYLFGATAFRESQDSARAFLILAKSLVEGNIFKNYNLDFANQNKAIVYITFGDYHYRSDNLDSALYYFFAADSLTKHTESILYKAEISDGIGNVMLAKKMYQKALTRKLSAIEIYSQLQSPVELARLYLEVQSIYNELDSTSRAAYYLNLYNTAKTEIESEKNKGVNTLILNLLAEEELKYLKAKQKNRNLLIFTVFGIVIFLIAFTLIFIIRYRRKKSRLLQEAKSAYLEQQQLTIAKEKELKKLKQKVDSSAQLTENIVSENIELKQKFNDLFEELIRLAKSNHPCFYARFQEVYPNIQNRLLDVNPNLSTYELSLCAYIYLGFTSKEIAALTFKSMRTIQNRKYHLRKRLNLSSTQDLYVWMKDFEKIEA